MKANERVYWAIVRACLREFFEYAPDAATQAVSRFRRRMKDGLSKKAFAYMYHTEPLYISENVAGRPLPKPEEHYDAAYDAILEQARAAYATRKPKRVAR